MSLNRKNVVVLAALVGFALGLMSNAQAQIQEVKVQVNGLACPFCVKGVEKHLKKAPGVKDVSTNLKKGEVTLHYKEGALFDIESLQQAVVKGGFTPGPVQVTARGKVARQQERFLLKVGGTGSVMSFLIREMHAPGGLEAGEMVSEKTKVQLEQAINSKQTLEMTGQVHSHKGGLPGLSIEKLNLVGVKEQGDD